MGTGPAEGALGRPGAGTGPPPEAARPRTALSCTVEPDEQAAPLVALHVGADLPGQLAAHPSAPVEPQRRAGVPMCSETRSGGRGVSRSRRSRPRAERNCVVAGGSTLSDPMAAPQRVLGSTMRALRATGVLGARVPHAPPVATMTPAQWGLHPVGAVPSAPVAACDGSPPMWGPSAPHGIFAPGTGARRCPRVSHAPADDESRLPCAGAPPIFAIKRQYQPSNMRRKRKHGFLRRAKTRGGRAVLKRRNEKGRWRLAC